MFLTEQKGEIAYPSQKILFSGNDSAYYPHEVVRLYLYDSFPKMHKVISEGIATYLGGSKELNYKEHIKILDDYLKKGKISISNYLFDDYERYKIIGANSSIMYSSGALLCDLAFKKYGKNGLFELMRSGRTVNELKKTIETLFNIKIENFDSFIKNELSNYSFK